MRHKKPTELENAGRLMRQVAQVIEDRGWTQGTVINSKGNICIRGGLFVTLTGRAYQQGLADIFENKILNSERHFMKWLKDNGHTDLLSWGVPGWNDMKGNTQEEVLRLMRKFADEVDPQRV